MFGKVSVPRPSRKLIGMLARLWLPCCHSDYHHRSSIASDVEHGDQSSILELSFTDGTSTLAWLPSPWNLSSNWLTLGMHHSEGYGSWFVCVSVCLSMAILALQAAGRLMNNTSSLRTTRYWETKWRFSWKADMAWKRGNKTYTHCWQCLYN